MKRLPPNQMHPRIYRERDGSALSRLALLLFCGVALTLGFLLAAKQHFAAINYGYKSQDLRREHQHLLAEQRQLMLLKEEATSPVRLEPAARGLGLQPVQPGQIAIRNQAKRSESHPAVVQAAASRSR